MERLRYSAPLEDSPEYSPAPLLLARDNHRRALRHVVVRGRGHRSLADPRRPRQWRSSPARARVSSRARLADVRHIRRRRVHGQRHDVRSFGPLLVFAGPASMALVRPSRGTGALRCNRVRAVPSAPPTLRHPVRRSRQHSWRLAWGSNSSFATQRSSYWQPKPLTARALRKA
jgi:hypothetical protein